MRWTNKFKVVRIPEDASHDAMNPQACRCVVFVSERANSFMNSFTTLIDEE